MDNSDPGVTVAVVGMGCRLPQAAGIGQFWKNLIANVDSVTPVPEERFDVASYYSAAAGAPGKTASRHGGFLDDPFAFDATFFGISPAEAVALDPQHRLLLSVAWEALEDAGIPPSSLAGSRTGVFVGQATADYASEVDLAAHTLTEATGSHLRAMASGRLSYALDLRGPSLTLDTACSSSLVAVHAARQSLLTQESDLAIVGGANVILSPRDAVAYSQAAMLAPDGRCKFGHAGADGFVRSEGVGVVVLKRLADALDDGDRILALLAGSAVTNDGRGSGFLLQPAVSGQIDMLRSACRNAGVSPASLDYVEAHGTGTTVGDDVELRALAEAAGASRPAGRPLRTGSVKSNIGHAEAAAGIAGLIKAVLVARHGIIPASLHADTPNTLLAEDGFPVRIVSRNTPLDKAGDRALIGVSSFGLSGTNAHVVVAEYPGQDTGPRPALTEPPAGRATHLLVLSARSDSSLRRLAASYAHYLVAQDGGAPLALQDICATAALRRDAHPYRLWVTGADHDELAAGLRSLATGQETENAGLGDTGFGPAPRTVFVFPGQGSQWLGMGRALLRDSAAFRDALLECDAAVREETGWSVVEVLTRSEHELPGQVEKVQPVLWAMEVALAAYWRDMGVEPDVCLGHSMGEAAAACVSGALTLRDAAAVICRRSALMQRVAGQGGMLATELSGDAAQALVRAEGGDVCVAAMNAPTTSVLAGGNETLERISRRLRAEGIFSRPVQVNVASHSPVMDQLRTELHAALGDVKPATARVPMYSSVRCATLREPEPDAAYWMDNLREPVRFSESVRDLAAQERSVFVEISPHPILAAAVGETLARNGEGPAVITSTRRGQDEERSLARSLGRLFAGGGRIRWERWFGGRAGHVPLPSYAWDEEHLRRTCPSTAAPAARSGGFTTELFYGASAADVRLHGLAPVPPAVYLSVLHEAAVSAAGGGRPVIENVRLGDDFVGLTGTAGVTLRTTLVPSADGGYSAVVRALAPDAGQPAVLCLTGSVAAAAEEPDHVRADIDAALSRCHEHHSQAAFLRSAGKRGYEFAPAFQAVRRLWRRDGEAVALLHRPDATGHALWEACLQPVLAALPATLPPHVTYYPVAYARVEFFGDLTEDFWVHTTFAEEAGGAYAAADFTVADREGRTLARFTGVTMRRLETGAADGDTLPESLLRLPGRAARLVRNVTLRPVLLAASLLAVLSPGEVEARAEEPVELSAVRSARAVPPRTDAGVGAIMPAGVPVDSLLPSVRRENGEAGAQTLIRCAASLLGMSPERIDSRRALRDYGLDSLMAVRLRIQLQQECDLEISVDRLLGAESAAELATM